MSSSPASTEAHSFYGRYLVLIAGLGGLLYGVDIGVFAAALLYLDKTIQLTAGQTSAIAAAVFGGSTLSSLIAGLLADWLGRKRMMLLGGLLYSLSIGIIVVAQAFVPLFLGRLLQGMAGGVIAVVVPLFLAESLSPETRGRGTAIFQFMLTVGIVLAAVVGFFYTRGAESAIASAHGNAAQILAAQNHAWRGMFLAILYPGLVFSVGCFWLSETPRWLYRRGQREAALASLRRSSTEADAQLQMREMEVIGAEAAAVGGTPNKDSGSLLQRKYVVPFVLACIVLACNQATGINSILTFLVKMLQRAGMDPSHATAGDVAVKLLNCLMTVVAVALVDRKGRRWLLKLGTGGVVVALLICSALFFAIEHGTLPANEETGAWVAGSLGLFIAAFAVGPGVVVWLMLSELMPTRIRSAGMGIALLLNQGVSTAIAGVFLPVVARFGYYAIFLFWAACTVVYFVTAAFFLPETKGRTLEEIEQHFERA